MRGGWQVKALKDVCSFENGDRGKNYPSKKNYVSDGVPFITAANVENGKILDNLNYISEDRFKLLSRGKFKKGDFLFCLRGSLGKFGSVRADLTGGIASSMVIVRAIGISNEWLGYYFLSDNCKREIDNYSGGAAQPNLGAQDLKKFKITYPPLTEQKQIVAILDKAFAAIDQAKANIEKNIENAKDLFQSKLNEIFSQKGDGWEEKSLGELFKLKSGDGLTAKKMIDGPYPVYGGNGIAGYHNSFNFDPPQVIIGRVGALCGNARFVEEKFWLTDNAFRVSDGLKVFNPEFAAILLNFANLRKYARQSAQPVVSNSSLKNVRLAFPTSLEEQVKIKEAIKSLQDQLMNLQSMFGKKIDCLEDLKKSILQKAFAGELIKDETESILQMAAEPGTVYEK